MMAAGERTWRRVEAPWAARGHALVAQFGPEPYTAWELPDGSWGLSYGTMDSRKPQRVYPTFTQARKVAERLRTRSPSADFLPVAANPAGTSPLADLVLYASREVRNRLPASWLRGAPRRAADGGVVVFVKAGVGRAAAERLRWVFPFPVKVMEVA